jgi:hypothetical protein
MHVCWQCLKLYASLTFALYGGKWSTLPLGVYIGWMDSEAILDIAARKKSEPCWVLIPGYQVHSHS